ncbi:hypothetical protein QBC37DRAFT_376092 [Rhypophila decipiens]|uniref:Uncharacterized protein n=1 Tax=Rhypophila decipiens TaxID=261697 RepID=A0AAN7B3H2_9PEZI|nr:hypothetical protein QBC37DRAFT_376092 [Rhypophila decipiens]
MAKVVSEMGDIPIRPDGLRVEDFSGITIFPRPGAHLPVYIPAEPWDKPHWDMFSVRSSPQQRQALQTALQAARSIGDYRLQATCLKILILHSQEPKSLMDLLATLQFEQGDTEGFLGTCLSKYIVLSSEDEASRLELIAEFEKLRTILPNKPGDTHPEPASCPPGVYYSNSICAPRAFLLWARDVITKVLADNAGRDGGENNFLKNKVEFWNGQLVNYGSRLPLTMANHIREKYQVQVPPHIQLPLPPVAAQMPPPQVPPAPSTIPAEAAFFGIPPNPQILQRGQVGFLRTMADPGSTVDPYRAAVSYGADPFALPATSQPSQRQTDQPGQATFSPPSSSNSYGDGLESSFSLTDDYSDSEDLGFQYPELDPIDSASNLLDYAPPPRHLRRIPLERDKIKMRDKTHSSHQRPVRRKDRTHDSNRKDSSHAINGSEFGITSTMSSSTMSSSGVGRETGDRPQKNKPEAPVLFDSEDLGFHYPELEDSDDGENDKRTMSPYIKVSREGKKQNLKITSDLSEQHDISIVMTNKTDATRSRVYTVKNGAVWEETATDPAGNDPSGGRGEGPETLDGIPISSTRPRTESRSSQQTVRPLKASILREGSPPLCATSALAGPSTSIQEEGGTVDDKSSRVRAQVDKANEYMDRNTVRWLDNRTDDAPSSSKPRQPSIAEPKLRNPAAPGNLVDAISADEYAHEDRAQTERTKEPRLLQRKKHQQPQRSKRDKRYHSFVISEDTGLQSDEAVQLSDSASASPDDDDDEMDSEPSQSIAKPSSLCYSI